MIKTNPYRTNDLVFIPELLSVPIVMPTGFHYLSQLTHWGRDKMAANVITTISNTFSWMKIYKFRCKVPLKFVPKGWSNSWYSSIGSYNRWVPSRRQAIVLTNDGWFTDEYMLHTASMSTILMIKTSPFRTNDLVFILELLPVPIVMH